ncbi:hypothetical protein F4677DRAFT_451312 [Hypoxylon crocopeplum]|nr:hypothetical protein F4677DRAFT_451312 [Hypoxylon crocopeplum]
MYFSRAVIIAALTTLISGGPTLPQDGAACEVSNDSPYVSHVEMTIAKLREQGGACANKNFWFSYCTTLAAYETGAIGICGRRDNAATQLSCKEVADYATDVKNYCAADGKVGGYWKINRHKRIIIFNSERM